MLKYDFDSLISAVLFNSAIDCFMKQIIKDPKVDPLNLLSTLDDFDFSVDHALQYRTHQHIEDKTSSGLRINNKKMEANTSMLTYLFLLKLMKNYHHHPVTILHQTRGQHKRGHLQQVGQGKDLEVCPVQHHQYQHVPS